MTENKHGEVDISTNSTTPSWSPKRSGNQLHLVLHRESETEGICADPFHPHTKGVFCIL